MESIIFAGAVFGMLWLCYIVYKSDKNANVGDDLGIFAFKSKKDSTPKVVQKK